MPPNPQDDFYDPDAPRKFQQGDIVPGAPLISVPASQHLVVVRHTHTGARLDVLDRTTPVSLHHEQAVPGAFDQREHVLVSAERGPAMIITQTCDLDDHENWQLCPLRLLEGSEVKEGMLFSDSDPPKGYRNLFGLPAHPDGYFEKSYVDLADVRSIHRDSVVINQRIASLSALSQVALGEKLAETFGREWGYRDGDEVPQDGTYRCHLCNWFINVDNPPHELKKGDRFPECPACKKRHKSPQWYKLQPNRRY